jgi:beta-N-acetylhexosaminidase
VSQVRPVISDCTGESLTAAEKELFSEMPPFGFILFQRNCQNPAQVSALTAEMRAVAGRDDVPILIDQEGGRVARLKPPFWQAMPAPVTYGALAAHDMAAAKKAAYLGARLIADDLRALGVTVDCLPLLDLSFPGAHDIIGDRAYGASPDLVAALGRVTCEGLLAGGVVPVIKHIPGHGRASVDSHVALPKVDAALADLRALDFKPFYDLRDMPVAMTAHVIYASIDPERPATISPRMIENIIRGELGFAGVLLSDDITMKALQGTLEERALASLNAGCDVILHCNGSLEERRRVLAASPVMGDAAFARCRHLMTPPQSSCFEGPAGFDRKAAMDELFKLVDNPKLME